MQLACVRARTHPHGGEDDAPQQAQPMRHEQRHPEPSSDVFGSAAGSAFSWMHDALDAPRDAWKMPRPTALHTARAEPEPRQHESGDTAGGAVVSIKLDSELQMGSRSAGERPASGWTQGWRPPHRHYRCPLAAVALLMDPVAGRGSSSLTKLYAGCVLQPAAHVNLGGRRDWADVLGPERSPVWLFSTPFAASCSKSDGACMPPAKRGHSLPAKRRQSELGEREEPARRHALALPRPRRPPCQGASCGA